MRRRVNDWMVVWCAIFVCCWGGNQFTPLLVVYEEHHAYSSVTVNMLLSVYVLGLIPTLLVAGVVSDRWGRRRTMVGGVAATLAGSVLLSLGQVGLPLLVVGRLLSGVGVGAAMAVGTSWLTELSRPPYDVRARNGSGAVRSATVFGAGSAAGAFVAGALAAWGPLPEVLPYLAHVSAAAPLLRMLRAVPDPRVPRASRVGPVEPIVGRDAAVGRLRMLTIVVPAAPWLFGAAAIGYGFLPTALNSGGSSPVVFATAASIVALSTSALIQPLARRIHSERSARGSIIGLTCLTAGTGGVAVAVSQQSLVWGIAANALIGVGIGISQVSGLREVQRIAGSEGLGALTGVFYALAYSGFVLPTLLAVWAVRVPVTTILWALVVLGAFTVMAMVSVSTRNIRTAPTS